MNNALEMAPWRIGWEGGGGRGGSGGPVKPLSRTTPSKSLWSRAKVIFLRFAKSQFLKKDSLREKRWENT